MTDFRKLLNVEQHEAVTAGDGPLLVLAAAGTGKTRTLVYRVAYLVEQGLPPESLLLLTFTNRAAREMLERAKEAAGPSVGNLWSGTFHHICNRFLRRYAHKLGYGGDFSILDRDDSRSVLSACMKEVVKDAKEFPKKDVIGALISEAANRDLGVGDVLDLNKEIDADPDAVIRIANLYRENKLKNNQMDFDDLLVNGLRLLCEHAPVREHYQEQFRHVLIDEYQDTNLLQAKMVDILAGKWKNVMAVGDDFQCIYSWRGADFRNIMEFPDRWPGCRIVKLEQNYRSVPEVLEVANACIQGNPEQFQKTLRAVRAPQSRPHAYFLRDGDEQARGVISLINRYINRGYSPKDIAVLYRAHFHSIELQMALPRSHLPYNITSGVGVFEQAHTKDVIAFLKVCAGASDQLAFCRLLGMLPGVGEKSAQKVWDKLGGTFDPSDATQREVVAGALRATVRGNWLVLDELFRANAAENLTEEPGELIQRFCDLFYTSYLHRAYEKGEEREDDIRELALQVGKSGDLKQFLSEVALLTNLDHSFARSQEGEEKIHLSTVHQAKGLEWPVVIVVWAVEGMFPSAKSVGESGGDAEERRLFYVAVTRAKDELVLCAPEIRRTRDGGMFFQKPSRFIREIPRGLLQEHYGLR